MKYRIFFVSAIMLLSAMGYAEEPASVNTGEDSIIYYSSYDVAPQFPDGLDALLAFLTDNTVYPEEARKEGVQGRVLVKFVISEEGKLSDVSVLNPIDPRLDAEAIRVISSMPDWIPASLNGEKVRAEYVLPITFKI